MLSKIPKEVQGVVDGLREKGYEAYVVGGCVRDLLLGRTPQDWDVATSASPDEIQKVFPDSFYENKFFTVTVNTGAGDPSLARVEVTTFRSEAAYGDHRRPEEVKPAASIEEDLARRDFTMNAVALADDRVVDPFFGQKDIEKKLVAAVRDPKERIAEDALRMMRAVRFASQLGFSIQEQTKKAIEQNAQNLGKISEERVRDELVKILMSERATEGADLLRTLGLLAHVIPELEEGVGVGQNKHHVYTVWEHNLRSLEYAVSQNWNLGVRLASLLHDVGKPRTKKGEGPDSTFYGHDAVGAKMVRDILRRLRFSSDFTDKVTKLVRYHMFYYNVDEVTDSSVRRLVRKVGAEGVEDLLRLRQADRIGSGVPKAEPYKFRHLRYVIDRVSKDPLTSSMLAIDGEDVMKRAGVSPGPVVGQYLAVLLAEVVEDPKRNAKRELEQRVDELAKLSPQDLQALSDKAREQVEKVETREDSMLKQKYWVE